MEDHDTEKRPTVIVTCAVPNGVQIRRHTPGLEDRAPMLPTGQGYELKQGVDKEWFLGWLKENSSLSLVANGQITWRDTPEPTEDEKKALEEQRAREEAERQRFDEQQQAAANNGDNPASGGPVMGIQDGPGNPERSAPTAPPEPQTNQGA